MISPVRRGTSSRPRLHVRWDNHGSSASLLHSAQSLTYRRQFPALSISLMHEFGLVRCVFAFLQDPRSLIKGVACNQSENKPS